MSELEYTAENVEKALHQLYHVPTIALKDIAQRWLTKAQCCKEAWQFSWVLLQEEKACEVQYFGASCLLSKISGAWSDIDDDDIFVLRDRLFEQLEKFCFQPAKKIVLTRLCVAFSAFVINCVIKDLWPTALTDIIQKLTSRQDLTSDKEYHNVALLEILTILPEELQSTRIERHEKGIVRHSLRCAQTQVFELLNALFHNLAMKAFKAHVIKCVSSWIALGIPLSDWDEFLANIIECVREPDLFDNSVECLLNVFCSPYASDYPNTIKKLVPVVLSLRPMLRQAIEEQNADTILGLTKIVCSLAENQTKLVIETYTDQQYGLGLIWMVIDCAGVPLQYPTEEWSSPISFSFWCTLQDEIQSVAKPDAALICHHFVPLFYEIINCLLRKGSYPKDNSHDSWSADEKEQHRIYRIDISDTLMYILDLLGGNNVLNYLIQKLQTCLTDSASDTGMEKPWHEIEICLFGIHCIVETITEDYSHSALNVLVDILPTIQVNSVQMADTMLYTIGTLTEWLSFDSEKLWVLFSFAMSCVDNNDLSLSSVLTLRRLARECNEHLIPYASNIMEQITKILLRGILRKNEEVWLMQCAGHVLSSLSQDDCIKYLQNLLAMQLHQLEALSEDNPSVPTKNSIIHIFELLANLFTTLDRRKESETGEMIKINEEQPAVCILRQLTPLFKTILNTWVADEAIVDAMCNLYDKAIRCLVNDFSPLVLELCEILCVIFQAYPHTSVLDLAQQVNLVFGGETDHKDSVSSIFQTIVTVSTLLYECGSIGDHPDVAHSFMRFLSHTCRKQFNICQLVGGENMQTYLFNLFKCGILTLQLPDSESANTGAQFLVDFLALSVKHTDVLLIAENSGKELLTICLKAIGGSSPRGVMDHFSDILFAIGHSNSAQFGTWLHELTKMPDIPCQDVDVTKKLYFVSQLLKECRNKRKCREIVKEFSLVCRGLHGTAYAAG